MTTPPWGHKPPAVDDRYRYWLESPSEPSARCMYWVRRLREGSWRPNKYLLRECYDCRASKLGVYIWEANHVLAPLFNQLREQRLAEERRPG